MENMATHRAYMLCLFTAYLTIIEDEENFEKKVLQSSKDE